MYQAHFKLSEEAFTLSPDPRFIYFTAQHKEALYKTEYAITQKKGISAIYGDIGAGKTSLARRLWEKYASNPAYNFRILPHSNYPSAYQLVKDILKEFKIDKPTRSISDALDALQAYLIHEYGQGKITVVVIDEAQDLRPKNFETIRQLLNFENNREKLLQIVLFGQNELSTKLDRQPALKDRIVTWGALTNLTFEDSVELINFRWRVAGGAAAAPFDQDALQAVYFYSNGLPRKISNICTNALIRTVASDLSVVNKDIVEYVAKEIRLDPALMKVKRIGRPKKTETAHKPA
jgi:general secretion pathway protein A